MERRMVPAVCFFCKNWIGSKLDLDEERIKQITFIEGVIGNVQTGTYRKCRAKYKGTDGVDREHDFGTLGGSPCKATDLDGNLLFEKIDG